MGGWKIAREQYSSLGEGTAVVSLGTVDMEEGVQVRVQVRVWKRRSKQRRETGEGQTRRDGQRTDNQTLIMDDMKME